MKMRLLELKFAAAVCETLCRLRLPARFFRWANTSPSPMQREGKESARHWTRPGIEVGRLRTVGICVRERDGRENEALRVL